LKDLLIKDLEVYLIYSLSLSTSRCPANRSRAGNVGRSGCGPEGCFGNTWRTTGI